ncbi:response regulator [Caulobacter sp. S45]|uniref:response regulator n=1 Tax=Caulobacter sp. S45 TaxID=1641861 RepID=UPI00131C69AD|nr:response regulator [Caulobacter sp. S45]
MRVLIVEDDAALARGLIEALRAAGLAVDHVTDGAEAVELVGEEPYSVVILDLGLPDIDGLKVLRMMRGRGVRTPVLILTARDSLNDRVCGLDQGADDYLAKPFEPAELAARVRALIRRGQGAPDPVLTVGALRLDRNSGDAYLDGQPLDLRRRELAVLEGLMVRAGKLTPKERLVSEVFGHEEPVGTNALEVYIARLRRKLEAGGVQIRTVRGLGYILDIASLPVPASDAS